MVNLIIIRQLKCGRSVIQANKSIIGSGRVYKVQKTGEQGQNRSGKNRIRNDEELRENTQDRTS